MSRNYSELNFFSKLFIGLGYSAGAIYTIVWLAINVLMKKSLPNDNTLTMAALVATLLPLLVIWLLALWVVAVGRFIQLAIDTAGDLFTINANIYILTSIAEKYKEKESKNSKESDSNKVDQKTKQENVNHQGNNQDAGISLVKTVKRAIKGGELLEIISDTLGPDGRYEMVGSKVYIGIDKPAPDGEYEFLLGNNKIIVRGGRIKVYFDDDGNLFS